MQPFLKFFSKMNGFLIESVTWPTLIDRECSRVLLSIDTLPKQDQLESVQNEKSSWSPTSLLGFASFASHVDNSELSIQKALYMHELPAWLTHTVTWNPPQQINHHGAWNPSFSLFLRSYDNIEREWAQACPLLTFYWTEKLEEIKRDFKRYVLAPERVNYFVYSWQNWF